MRSSHNTKAEDLTIIFAYRNNMPVLSNYDISEFSVLRHNGCGCDGEYSIPHTIVTPIKNISIDMPCVRNEEYYRDLNTIMSHELIRKNDISLTKETE
jgi:hypothetical protein